MFNVITILSVLASLALVFIVLVQKSKGGGLASGFAASNSIMGVRKTTDFLEKATWWLAGIIMVLCLASTAFLKTSNGESDGNIIGNVKEKTEVQAPNVPSFEGVKEAPQMENAPAQETPAKAE